MENNQGGKKNIYIAIIALLLLINGVGGYLLWSENKEKKDLTEQKAVIDQQFADKSAELDAIAAELEQFKGKNAELDSLISEQQGEIAKQKQQIQNLLSKGKLTKAELDKANQMLEEYRATIAVLQQKVEQLSAENKQLQTEKAQLTSDLTAEKQTTSQLTEQNKGLSKKVELGSLLQVRNMEVVGIRKKGSGKEVTVKRVKTTESLRISFETGDNKVLEAGNVSLYIRVLNPKGETISVADQGSGSLKLTETGETVQYTKKADFNWDQTNKKIVVYWSQNIKDEGTYKVEVYQSGYLVGKGQVELN